ncbi:flagellin [Tropicibacter oceani]|uniref:Flagellin n=1 Tax=Tropicibacter oceani TaxID=3058420 RepID=A0ABY8QCB2_9RHOB|nr:flagellin [Tropicibacter oceani]WGW02257.1 flagellin [Tropicibacter oceani]
MSSILTNNAATTALATLRNINSQLAETQNQISTGKAVSGARDNAAVWAISKTMRADIAGFQNVSNSLMLGQSTMAVARQGAETITELLTDIKGKIVSAQEGNVDREKIQNNIKALKEQIEGITGSAAFNGQNMLQNNGTDAGSGTISVLASIDRSGSGVSSSDMTFNRRDMGTGAQSIAATGGTFAAAAATGTVNATQSATIDLSAVTVEAGAAFSLSVYGTDGNNSAFDQASYRTTAGANETQAEMATSALSYVARDGDTMADVAKALTRAWDNYSTENNLDPSVLNIEASGRSLKISSTVTDGTDSIAVNVNKLGADAANTIGGGLQTLGDIDVTTNAGASKALSQIEGLINYAIDAAAGFGSDQGRIDTQSDFVSKISATLRDGVGKLEDADMEDTSARLQALQVQQQLAVQALSIANSQPQQLLALFR